MAEKLTKGLQDLTTALDQADVRINEDVARFRARIAELEAKVTTGTVTDEELAILESLKVRVDAIDPDNTATRADVPLVEGTGTTEV